MSKSYEFEKIYKMIEKGELYEKEVMDLIFPSGKSSVTQDWKKRREKIIKDSCEQCGSDNELSIHQDNIPRKYGEYKHEAARKYFDIFDKENSIEDIVPYEEVVEKIKGIPTKEQERCPFCGHTIRKRRKMSPACICSKCSKEFDTPLKIKNPTFIDDINKGKTLKKPYEKYYTEERLKLYGEKKKAIVWETYEKEIEKEALLKYMSANISYLKLENSRTLCKVCSFNYNKNNTDICTKCKVRYKKVYYETCWDCR